MEQELVRCADGSLEVRLDQAALQGSCCTALCIGVQCPSAAVYDTRATYAADRAWTCNELVGTRGQRCQQHWFSQFICCAANEDPVAIAHNTPQLAQVLHVPTVSLVDGNSVLLQEPPWGPQPQQPEAEEAAVAVAAEVTAMEVEAATAPTAPTACGSYSEDGSTLSLDVPRPIGNWTRNPCAALFLVLDVDSASSFSPGTRHSILQCCRCGNESGNKLVCGKHKMGGFFLMAQNGDVLAQPSCLSSLAEVLGVQQVLVEDPLHPLQAKLQEDPAAAPLAGSSTSEGAAAGGTRQERGQKRSVDEDTPLSPQSSPKVAAAGPSVQSVPLAVSSLTGCAVLRMWLTPQQAEEARQKAAALQQYRQPLTQQNWQDAYQMQQEVLRQQRLQQGVVEMKVEVATGTCAKQPCMGINLRLGVANVEALAACSGPVRVAAARRCGNEGGIKKCCKQHRISLFVLTDTKGGNLPGAAHLAGLASMLQVASVELIDDASQQPLQDYLQLPLTGPTWQSSPDNGCFSIWLPKAQAGSCKPCCGLDIFVALPQGRVHTMGSVLPVVNVNVCGNDVGSRAACRRHLQGMFQIVQQGTNNPFQVCTRLGELAIWLGMGKVEVLDAESHQPISQYLMLVDPPVQLSINTAADQLQSSGLLLPPSLSAQPPASWQAGLRQQAMAADPTAAATVTAAAAGGIGLQRVAAAAVGMQRSPAGGLLGPEGGNCSFELLAGGDGLLVRVEPRPQGAWQRNACRALEVLLALPPGQGFIPGQQYQILSIQRCSNEAGGRTRCRHHMDGAVNLLGVLQFTAADTAGPGAAAMPLQTSKLSVLAKANSSAQLVDLLRLQSVVLVDKASGDELGELEAWSQSLTTGSAAKVQLSALGDTVAPASAGAAAAAQDGPGFLPAGLAVQLPGDGQAAAVDRLAFAQLQQQQQQQQPPLLQQLQRLQQQAAAHQQMGTPMQLDRDAAVAAAVSAAAAVPAIQQQPQQQQQQKASMPSDTSRLGLYRSRNPVAADKGAGAGFAAEVAPAAAKSQDMQPALQSSGIATRIAGLGGQAVGSAGTTAGSGFTTSAPILRMAAAFSAAANT